MKRWFIIFFSRIFRVLTLDRKVFIEIYADPKATLQSFILVLLVSFSVELSYSGIVALEGIGVIRLLVYGALGWIIEAILAFVIGRFILPMPGTGLTPPSVARAITFSSAPLLIMIFGLIPVLSSPLLAITSIWGLVVTAVAMKYAFAWSFRRAIAGMIILQVLLLPIFLGLDFLLW